MSTTDLCCDRTCPPLPDGFVRLRYFFGKRLGVVDLKDEQAYHREKLRFHTRHLHGYGVVCGLGLSAFTDEEGAVDGTVLRVGRGAAIDTCGREIVVPWDQCIDLSAWVVKKQDEAEAAGVSFPPEPFRICIAVRYRECPTTPEAAPRDPCGTDTGGCEYGRVVEGFELTVLLEDEAAPYLEALPPSGPGLPCAESRSPDWIVLGCLELTLDGEGVLLPLPDPATWTGPPIVLPSVAAIAATSGGVSEPIRLDTSGPQPILAIAFAEAPAPPSVENAAFALHRLDVKGWKSAGKFTVTASGRTVTLKPSKTFFRAEGRYRITTVDSVTPLVDEALRPLRLQRSFTLTDDGGALVLHVTSTT